MLTSKAQVEQCLQVRERLVRDGVYLHWRISPVPFSIGKEELAFIESLGTPLYLFYKAANKLYYESIHNRQPEWVSGYLDQGKPQALVEYARMNRMKGLLPGVIRPDILLTPDGMVATELDSVPGGMGITGSLGMAYSAILDNEVAGGGEGMTRGFLNMLRTASHTPDPVIAIVVSEESRDYRSEMEWMARAIREGGGRAFALRPEEVLFTEEGLFFDEGDRRHKIDVLYRFFELFDLKNIPKTELILYSAKKKGVTVTPPFKPFLEEKLLYALFHHPRLRGYWIRELGEEVFSILHRIFPVTWIMDPAEMPPYGIIPGLKMGERPVASWRELSEATQGEREFVIKPSGFSELAWGSRGVVVGHDISQEGWRDILDKALNDFYKTPYILQEYHRGRHVEVSYLDDNSGRLGSLGGTELNSVPAKGEVGLIKQMPGRVRLCPYYFVEEEGVRLRGMLATVCSLEKKLIHGMEDAVMTVAGVQ